MLEKRSHGMLPIAASLFERFPTLVGRPRAFRTGQFLDEKWAPVGARGSVAHFLHFVNAETWNLKVQGGWSGVVPGMGWGWGSPGAESLLI